MVFLEERQSIHNVQFGTQCKNVWYNQRLNDAMF